MIDPVAMEGFGFGGFSIWGFVLIWILWLIVLMIPLIIFSVIIWKVCRVGRLNRKEWVGQFEGVVKEHQEVSKRFINNINELIETWIEERKGKK